MIYIIIINKNEKYFRKSLDSIHRICETSNYQIRYYFIDSGSDSKLINDIKESINSNYGELIIEHCTNAAESRNVGINKILDKDFNQVLFVDSDFEVNDKWFKAAIKETKNCESSIICGPFKNIYIEEEKDDKINGDFKRNNRKLYLGGIFLTTKKALECVEFFDSQLTINEDLDYLFRSLDFDINVINLPILMGNHYTLSYTSNNRVKDSIKKNHMLYVGIMWSKYYRSKYFLSLIKRSHKFFFLLFLIGLLTILMLMVSPVLSICILFGFVIYMKYKKVSIANSFLLLISTFQIIAGFILGERLEK